ncbi:MAG: ribonuclease P protein component [Treponema sp.]|nr:ribonuclease P protein component [Treponema sp.]
MEAGAETAHPFRFGRHERLKKRVEITRVFRKGRQLGCPGLKLYFLDNGLPYNRIVITFVKKYGNAVERNRARRVSREAYRLMRPLLKTGYDVAVLICAPARGSGGRKAAGPAAGTKKPDVPAKQAGKPRAARPTLASRTEQFTTLFSRAGILA